jgi:(2R)-ethylmalonyl-CoA mutase
LSKDARARAVQLPAWNEALGLPRPWDQQWSLRLQQILAFETDLLEFDDIFTGSKVIETKVAELKAAAREELRLIDEMGGAVAAIESSYMKQRLVESNARRVAAIEAGAQIVVGVNQYTDSAPSPLTAGGDGGFLTVDPAAETEAIARIREWRAGRDDAAAKAALAQLDSDARAGRNIMPASIACAHAGVTTGEWGAVLRRTYGEYRAPTGVSRAASNAPHIDLEEMRARVDAVSARLGRRIKILVGKPGLDGHSNGAEQIAVRARDCGMELVYDGIRLTPADIADAALKDGVHVIGLSVLSGSHITLVEEVLGRLRANGLGAIPVVVGGIVPPDDAERLTAMGVARIYTPKDYDLCRIMGEIVDIVEAAHSHAA